MRKPTLKTNKKSITAAILLVFVLALTAACGKTETSSSSNGNKTKQETASSTSKESKADLEAYVRWYDKHMNALEDEAATYNDLMSNSIVGNKKWEKSVDESIKRAEVLIKEGKNKKDVPKTFKKAHKHLLNAGDDYQYIVDNTDSMIANYDIDLMEDISVSHDNVSVEIGNADIIVDKIVEDKDLDDGSEQ